MTRVACLYSIEGLWFYSQNVACLSKSALDTQKRQDYDKKKKKNKISLTYKTALA